MSVKFIEKEFSRVGRKTEGEVEQKYKANILTDDSIDGTDSDSFIEDVLKVVAGDLKLAAEYFRTGANQHLRLAAGGYSPEEKAAKALMKAMPAAFTGKTLEDVVALVKSLGTK
jgi:hypothetical protein